VITTYQVSATSGVKNTPVSPFKPQKPLFVNKNNENMIQLTNNKSIVNTMLINNNAIVDISKDGDVLEISKQGMEKSQTLNTEESNSLILDSEEKASQIEETQEVNSDVESVEDTSEDISEDTSGDSSDLTTYSDYELSQMLSKGSISSADYYLELDRREALKNA